MSCTLLRRRALATWTSILRKYLLLTKHPDVSEIHLSVVSSRIALICNFNEAKAMGSKFVTLTDGKTSMGGSAAVIRQFDASEFASIWLMNDYDHGLSKHWNAADAKES